MSSFKQDDCALRLRDKGNASIFDYNIMAFDGRPKPCTSVDNDFVYKNHVNSCQGHTPSQFIDNESQILYNQYSRGPEKNQYDTRTFLAVPDLKKGTHAPLLESQLLFNGDSRQDKYTRCTEPLSEKPFQQSCCPVYVPAMQDHIERYSSSIAEFESFLRAGTSARDTNVHHPEIQKCMDG